MPQRSCAAVPTEKAAMRGSRVGAHRRLAFLRYLTI
jgi:hypothetical protein